jgi:hypothetical protein
LSSRESEKDGNRERKAHESLRRQRRNELMTNPSPPADRVMQWRGLVDDCLLVGAELLMARRHRTRHLKAARVHSP